MATLQHALRYKLANTSGVTDLVGTRIWHESDAPQDTASPYITYQRISQDDERHQGGGPNLTMTRVQINCVVKEVSAGTSPEISASAVATAVKAALAGTRGEMGEPGDTLTVRGIFFESSRDITIQPFAGGQRGPHEVQMDWFVHYVEE